MTISGWITFTIIAACVLGYSIFLCINLFKKIWAKATCILVAVLFCVMLLFGMLFYYNYTASGQRALTDQKSNLANGMERTITVYTADGKIIAQYTGKIDIEGNDGGYVLFDYDGKRYTYYNCFVESIAEID